LFARSPSPAQIHGRQLTIADLKLKSPNLKTLNSKGSRPLNVAKSLSSCPFSFKKPLYIKATAAVSWASSRHILYSYQHSAEHFRL
jgi:hypothetical protein